MLSAGSLAGILVYGWIETHSGLGPHAWIFGLQHRLILAALLVLITVTTPASHLAWQRVIVNPFFKFISDISYNAFLWNAPVIAFLWLIWHGAPPLPFVLVSCTIITALATVITYCFERPLMRFGGRLENRFPKPALQKASA